MPLVDDQTVTIEPTDRQSETLMPLTTDDQVAIVKPTSSFLALSAELRNEIYEYALMADSGLVEYREDHGHPTLRASDGSHLNQSKFVNKQLRKETQGLELKYNTVSFLQSRSSRGYFPVTFMQMLSPRQHPWLTSIVIRASCEIVTQTPTLHCMAHMLNWFSLVNFCESNPDITVRLALMDWEIKSAWDYWGWWAYTGCQVATMCGRGDSIAGMINNHPQSAAGLNHYAGTAKHWRAQSQFGEACKRLHNLVVFPDVTVLDAEKCLARLSRDLETESLADWMRPWAR